MTAPQQFVASIRPIVEILRWEGSSPYLAGDELTEEEPLEIRVRGRAISVTMRTPGHDAELALGFLLSEGIVRSATDVLRVEPCGKEGAENVLNVLLAPEVYVDFEKLTRHVFAASSCGLCGKATIDAVTQTHPPLRTDDGIVIEADTLAQLPDRMRLTQETFERTGGLHAAALFDAATGKIIAVREDVGRHNAVDKVIGRTLMQGGAEAAVLARCGLLVSGRASFEIMQKALAARIPIVAAVSAPSTLAATFATESGQTLIGFVRGRRMNVYSHPGRVRFPGKFRQ